MWLVRLILRLFDTTAWVIRGLSGDYAQFRAIVETKLTLDMRRPMSAVGSQARNRNSSALLGAMFMYAFMGLFVAFTPMVAGSALVGMTIVHAFIMTMLSLSLVADFSSVLLDTTDNAILQPRPVSGRTIILARIAHILVYLGSLTLALSAASLVVGTVKWGGLFPPVFALTLVCSVGLVVCVVTLFYLAAMRFTTGERLRDLIMYVQIAMSIMVVVGYQLVPRLIDMNALKHLRIDDRAWIYACPAVWMAAPTDLLAGRVGSVQLILTALCVGVPAIGLWATMRFLGSGFSGGLAGIDAVTRASAPPPARLARSPGLWLGQRLYRRPIGRAAFEFVWQICARDRQFKQRTYSSLAFLIIFPVIWLVSGQRELGTALTEIRASQRHLFLLYMVCGMLPGVLVNLRFSDSWPAGWVYTALPIARPGDILAPALGAVAVRFVVPVFGLTAALILAVWGPGVVDDILLAGCATFLMCGLHGLLVGRQFPFAQAFATTDASGRFGRNLLLLLIPAVLGGLHYALTFLPWSTWPICIPVLLVGAILFRSLARTPWNRLD